MSEEELQEFIYEQAMSSVRGALWERRISYDGADKIAEALGAGVRRAVRRLDGIEHLVQKAAS